MSEWTSGRGFWMLESELASLSIFYWSCLLCTEAACDFI